MKMCARCKEILSVESFGNDSSRKDGLSIWCKPCRKEYRATPRYRAQSRVHSATFYRLNKDKVLDGNREWKARNIESVNASMKDWKAKNRMRVAEIEATRRARIKGVSIGNLSPNYSISLFDFYGNVCINPSCSTPITTRNFLTVDHVVPVSRGGSHDVSNMQPLCLSCNCAKGNRSSSDYRNGKIMTDVQLANKQR